MGGARTPRRLDQRSIGSTGVMLPAPLTNIIRAQIIIVSGGRLGGVFVYDGVPRLGNPPIAYMTAGTVDPFGNVLPSPGLGAIEGQIGGAVLAPTQIYSPGFQTGGGYPVTYPAVYPSDVTMGAGWDLNSANNTITVRGPNGSSIVLQPDATGTMFAEIVFNSGSPSEDTPSVLVNDIQSNFIDFTISGPGVDTFTDTASINLNSQNFDGSSNANGALGTNNGAQVQWDKTGVSAFALQDGNVYDVGERVLILDNDIIVSSTTQLFDTLATQAGKYKIDCILFCTQGPGTQPQGFSMGNGGNLGTCSLLSEGSTYQDADTVNYHLLTAGTLNWTVPASAGFAGGAGFFVKIKGTMEFTAGSDLALFGVPNSGTNDFTVHAGSMFALRPARHTT